MKKRIFISSAQKEFAEERQALKAYLLGDALLSRFFDVFLFEDLPASDRRADAAYLDEVRRCDLYLALLGNEYGREDAEGISPTQREFDEATKLGKPRIVFVKGTDDAGRHPKMRDLITTAGAQLIRRRFTTDAELIAAVYASLVQHLEEIGVLQSLPFDERLPPEASLDDLDPKTVAQFVRRARHERQFPLVESSPIAHILAHLNLLREGRPIQAALLLFGRDPQRFFPSAEIRCMHFHGTEIQRPAPFYRIFKGNLFSQVDQAVDFVLSKINFNVGTRTESVQVPTAYEVPPDVIREAIVNAVVHRDYLQPSAVQVSVFKDRIEITNAGEILPPLTLSQLRRPHRSISRNARLCEALYLAGYIEKFGTGTLMMIRESAAHGLPEPDFDSRPGEFSSSLWRDWLTQTVVTRMGLNGRQSAAIPHLKIRRRITNAEYRELTGVIARTASRDLEDLVAKGVLQKTSKTGRGTAYMLVQKPDINRTNKTSSLPPTEQDINKTNRTSTSSAIGSEMAQSAQTPSKPTRRNAAKPNRKPATHAPKATRRRGKKEDKA